MDDNELKFRLEHERLMMEKNKVWAYVGICCFGMIMIVITYALFLGV